MSNGTAGFLNGPTPIDAAPRLAVDLGLDADDLLIKRDDLMGLGGGGNKVRKLQVTMGQALDAAADVVVTTGAPQSNHARLTAAAGARVGLLDRLLGAEIIWSGDRPPEAVADEVERDRSRGRVHRIPFGGSSPASAEAYARAGEEVIDQVPDVRHVVVAVGSGGTMAGLVTALGAERVLGVDTGAVPDARSTVHALMAGMRAGPQVAADSLRIDDGQVGQGYEHLAEPTRAALTRAARTEGLVLDPTYSGRAMAGLVSAVASGDIRPGDRTVFLHTGGLPGLFGHEDVLMPVSRAD